MDKYHNPETGHYENCGFTTNPNITNNGYKGRTKCKCKYDSLITSLSCGEKLCTVCWPEVCKKNKWDHQLSKCANVKCDILKVSLKKRAEINQTNIMSKIGVTPKIKYGHISYKRRRDTVHRKLAKKQQQSVKTRSMQKGQEESEVDEFESEDESENEEETEKEEESEKEVESPPKIVAELPKIDKKPGKTFLCVNGIKMQLDIGPDGETIINLDV